MKRYFDRPFAHPVRDASDGSFASINSGIARSDAMTGKETKVRIQEFSKNFYEKVEKTYRMSGHSPC
jgi:hypothetical protein